MRHLKMVVLTALLVPFFVGNISAQDISFSQDIQPLLSMNCLRCHKAGSAKGGYDMSSYSNLFEPGKSGEAPIVEGKPDESYLIGMISLHEKNGKQTASMPKQADPLQQAEIDMVANWIAQGATEDNGNVSANNTSNGNAGNNRSNGNNENGQQGGEDLIRTDPLLSIADMNRDGSLSLEELDTISRILHEMDWNRDGRLTMDELNFDRARTNEERESGRNRGGRSANADTGKTEEDKTFANETLRQLYGFDRNKDNKLSRSELPGYLRSIMSTADKNKDRFLDEFEIQEYADSVTADKKK